jgi:hypothetical protein
MWIAGLPALHGEPDMKSLHEITPEHQDILDWLTKKNPGYTFRVKGGYVEYNSVNNPKWRGRQTITYWRRSMGLGY